MPFRFDKQQEFLSMVRAESSRRWTVYQSRCHFSWKVPYTCPDKKRRGILCKNLSLFTHPRIERVRNPFPLSVPEYLHNMRHRSGGTSRHAFGYPQGGPHRLGPARGGQNGMKLSQPLRRNVDLNDVRMWKSISKHKTYLRGKWGENKTMTGILEIEKWHLNNNHISLVLYYKYTQREILPTVATN